MSGFMTAKQARDRQQKEQTDSNTAFHIHVIKERIEDVVKSGRVNYFINYSFTSSVDTLDVVEYFKKLGYKATLFDGGDCITVSW
jgi:ATP-dependent RNA circularization protein (DNA/RNA ligase family)